MEFKGTKGKWVLITESIFGGKDNYQKISAGCGYYDDKQPNLGFGIAGHISKENALLISKVPEMLEMLKALVNGYDLIDLGDTKVVLEAKQLIKSATEINE